jgi:hypothetical protein
LNNEIENKYLQKEALNEGIPHQIHPKTFSEKGQTFSIRIFSLQPDKGDS